MNESLIRLFNEQQNLLQKAITKLKQTQADITTHQHNFLSQEEYCELLTARFSRLADLYTQKLLSLLFRLLQEPDLSFIDKCHQLEKLGLVESAQKLYSIRKLKNQIAHEYAENIMITIYTEALAHTPVLISMIEKTCAYIAKQIHVSDS